MGARCNHHRGRLEADRLHHGDLPRRAADDPAHLLRGCARRRRRVVATVLGRHLAIADADHSPAADHGSDRLVPGLRPRLRDDPGGPARRDERAAVLPLQRGLPDLPPRLRGGDRLGDLPRCVRRHRAPVAAVQGRRMAALTSRIRPRALGQRALLHLLLLSTAFVVFLPYLWMVTTSLKPLKLTFQPPFLIPEHFEWHNYADAWNAAPFDRFYVNSIIMAAAIAVGQVLTSAMAAYAFERLEFPFKNMLFFVFLGTLMIPLPLLLIPSYVIVERFGWLNTFYALIVPLSRPAVATLGLFAFLFAWNDFLWPLIMLDNPDMFTIQLGLANFAGKYGTQWVQLMAGTVTATLPVLVFFVFVQRWIIRGLTMGAINE